MLKNVKNVARIKNVKKRFLHLWFAMHLFDGQVVVGDCKRQILF